MVLYSLLPLLLALRRSGDLCVRRLLLRDLEDLLLPRCLFELS